MSIQTISTPHGNIHYAVTEHCDNVNQLTVWIDDGSESVLDCTGDNCQDIDHTATIRGLELLGVSTKSEAYSDLGITVEVSPKAFVVYAQGVDLYTHILDEPLHHTGEAFIEAMVYYGMPAYFFFDDACMSMITISPDNLATPDNGQIVLVEWQRERQNDRTPGWDFKWTPTKRRRVVRMHLQECSDKDHGFFSNLLEED